MATRTWTGAGADNLASNALNWDGVPAGGDDLLFDGVFPVTGVKNCTWDTTTGFNTLTASSGYTGTITCTSALNINSGGTTKITFDATGTLNTNGQAVSTGAFDGSGAATKTVTLGASVWTISGGFNISGASLTWTQGTSEVIFVDTISGSFTITAKSGAELYKFTVKGSPIITLASDLIVNNTADLNNTGGSWSLNGATFTLNLLGNVSSTNGGANFVQGNSSITFSGSAAQVWTWGGTGAFAVASIINKSGGSLTYPAAIKVSRGMTRIAGTITTNSSNFTFVDTISGSFTLSNMQLFDYSTSGAPIVTLSNNTIIERNITIGSTSSINAGAGTLSVGGNWTNSGTFTRQTSTVVFNG